MSLNTTIATVLGVSPIICLISNSWLIIWVALELNTIAFCSIINTPNNNDNSNNIEISINYFIIQSISSAILIFTIAFSNEAPDLITILLLIGIISLMVKAASSPFHQWFVEVTNNTNWNNATILITWQKLAPIYLVIFQNTNLILGFAALSAITGAMLQINNNNTLEIIALSSVFNLGWILFAISSSINIFFIFCTIYWSSVILIIIILQNTSRQEISENSSSSTNNWIFLSVIANLAGIPPLAGFLANWIVLTNSIEINTMIVITIILVASAINLFVYLRIFSNSIIENSPENQNTSYSPNNNVASSVILINSIPIVIIIILGNAWIIGLFW